MAKFEKFDPQKQIHGLAEAVRKILAEELIRNGKIPSFEQLVTAIDETRQKYLPRILAARLLLADLFGVEPDRVAKDIQRERAKLHKQNSEYCEVRS
jgi:hypothetical protein